jgi:YggT family protein
MGSFLEFIVDTLLGLLILALVLSAILSWLIAFDVINTRNRVVYQFTHFLDAVTRPILRPVQRVLPLFGGVDLSPLVAIVVLVGLRAYIVPLIFAPLRAILG